MTSVRLSLVQPFTHFGPDHRKKNLEEAAKHVEEAARQGAQLVVFPETYPGEWAAPVTWTPVDELSDMAKQFGVHLVGGYAEPIDSEGVRCWNSFSLFGSNGAEIGRYRRTTPRHTPWIYKGGRYWDFDWVAADELPVFETELGTIGILMCSEVYATECARGVALKGADITLLPAGLPGPHSPLHATWRTLIWARAIENLMYTAVCSNIPVVSDDQEGRGTGGLAMVCSPEDILLDESAPGVHTVDLDLDRLTLLRENEDRRILPDEERLPWKTKPGTLRDWRREAVFQANPEIITGMPDPVR